MLKQKGRSYGYDLAGELGEHALTDAAIEKAVLYRTLRQLEGNGYVLSDWEDQPRAPARRVYSLTSQGERHLLEWAQVLGELSESMSHFVEKVYSLHTDEAGAVIAGQDSCDRDESKNANLNR